MMQMQVSQTTEADAIAYRDHVRALGPVRLSDLAYHMAETGGPVEAMDGSIESLQPLWTWYTSRMALGFPEVPNGSVPSYTRFLQWKLANATGKAAYAIEPVAHYLLVLLRRYLPDAHWDLHPPVVRDDDSQHLTVVLAGNGYERPLEQIPYGLALTVLKEMGGRSAPDYLRTKAVRMLGLDGLGDPLSQESAVLLSYLQEPPVPASDRRRFITGAGSSRTMEPPTERVSVALERHYIAAADANLNEPLEALPVMDASRLAPALAGIGAHVSGRALSESDLLNDESVILLGDWLLQIVPQVSGNRLRSLRIELLQGSAEEWERFEEDLRRVAVLGGAKFAPVHEFES